MNQTADGGVDGPKPDAADKDKSRDKSKMKGKVIRVLTVLAYVLSVSLAAIMLSLYYVFLWDPKMPSVGRLQTDDPKAHTAALGSPDSALLDTDADNATELLGKMAGDRH